MHAPTSNNTSAASPAPLPSSSAPRPARMARAGLGDALTEDWRHLVRTTQAMDLDQALLESGYRPYRSTRAARADTTEPWVGAPAASGVELADDADLADGRLAQLVAEAAHDPLAARIVLQRLLPGLISIARRRGRQRFALTVRLYNELLANAWIVIRCYPIHRRPQRVAANLLLDVEYQTFVREARLVRVRTVAHRGATWDGLGTAGLNGTPSGASHAFDELLEVLRDAREAGARPQSLQLAAALASGRSLGQVAEETHRSERAERYRRARVASELRSLVVDEPPAARSQPPARRKRALPA